MTGDLPGALLVAGLEQRHQLADARRPQVGTALRGVDPAQVALAVERGQGVEELGGPGPPPRAGATSGASASRCGPSAASTAVTSWPAASPRSRRQAGPSGSTNPLPVFITGP